MDIEDKLAELDDNIAELWLLIARHAGNTEFYAQENDFKVLSHTIDKIVNWRNELWVALEIRKQLSNEPSH